MNNDNRPRRAIIDQAGLPPMFPTHKHSASFWEKLGRAIATFGFLEEVLGKAIFVFTATRHYEAHEVEGAFNSWIPQLERALSDQLWNLSESYQKAVREHPQAKELNVEETVSDIKNAAIIRNVLCHGSWRAPSAEGLSIPLFVNRKMELFDTPIDDQFLDKVQRHVAGLACMVINSVTFMGWQFPGGAGPGKPIW